MINKSISSIIFKQLFWTFLISSVFSFTVLTIFFSFQINKWFTMEDVMTLNILVLAFNLCLTLTSTTVLFNLSIKVRNNKNYLIVSYFLFPLLFTIITFVGILNLKQKDIYPLDFIMLYLSYGIVITVFFISHSFFYLKFRRHLKNKFRNDRLIDSNNTSS